MAYVERQNDELVALSAILGEDNFVIYEEDPPSGRLITHVRLSSDYYLCWKSDNNEEKIYRTEHLTPISILFHFPETYPEESPPAFLLQCKWLTIEQLSKVAKHLDKLWSNAKDAILYDWSLFLENELLDFLNISNYLDITSLLTFKIQDNMKFREPHNPKISDLQSNTVSYSLTEQDIFFDFSKITPCVSGGTAEFDSRAFNDLSDGKRLIGMLQEYNEFRCDEVFSKTVHTCAICCEKKEGSEFVIFKKCSHFFCVKCVKYYFEQQICDGYVNYLKCLEANCMNEAPDTLIRKVVKPELFAKYEGFLLHRTLETMSDVRYCPRFFCRFPVVLESDGTAGICTACDYVFCPYCGMTYHGISPCKLKFKDREKIYEDYTTGDKDTKLKLELQYGKQVLKNLVEDVLSEKWKAKSSKNCPHCNACIEKSEGCNKMTCYRCNTYFCWICGERIMSSNPYEHFSNRGSPCYNQLFPPELVLENELGFEDFEPEAGEFL